MKLVLKSVRLSFPDIFAPRAFKPGDKPKYKAAFLIPKDDAQIAVVEAAIKAAATEKWGAKADGILKSIRGNANKFCFQDGDTKTYDGYEGVISFAASNDMQPVIVGTEGVTSNADKDPNRDYLPANKAGFMFQKLE